MADIFLFYVGPVVVGVCIGWVARVLIDEYRRLRDRYPWDGLDEGSE